MPRTNSLAASAEDGGEEVGPAQITRAMMEESLSGKCVIMIDGGP